MSSFDSVYLKPLPNFKKWYTPYENENQGKTIVRLNNVILTKVKVKSINDVDIPARYPNNLRSGAINFGDVYVCDGAHDEILETIFQWNY